VYHLNLILIRILIFGLSFFFIQCNWIEKQENTLEYNISDKIGERTILEYPSYNEYQNWVKKDSQYVIVWRVRKYYENFVSDDFFEREENKIKYNELTWSMIAEYQKRYRLLLEENKSSFAEEQQLNKFVDSITLEEYPKINQFISDVFRLGFD
tara:strand:+ start:218 stop:679 length:462 start_codon:yes stop_codon:yes gene_type:complete